ncbi:MAG TPA: agmatinase family protein [Solirubrobacteraceae bacterium]|nr:agmatinase family protein [Solirubrobacteraceae bacterium]
MGDASRGGSGGGVDRSRLQGMRMLRRLADIPDKKQREAVERGLELGLEAAPSVNDRTISTFARGGQPAFAGINTFLRAPYCENIHEVSKYEVAIVGAPFDMGTTYRAGARFGPQAVRRISALYDGYSLDMGCDLVEELDVCDVGDVFVIPSNIEKSFDQVDRAVSHVLEAGVFPIIIGGDHSLGYPDVRAMAKYVDGNVGIIHLDRHIDIQERDMDERMHTTPWFHATNIPNAPPSNLVQMGIGGWYGSRPGLKVARERGTTAITIHDVEEIGVEKAVEIALEVAWKDAKAVFLSFDIDSIDAGFVPGTGSPEPGGLLPREALKALRMIAREGICGMEVVEIAPPYDVSDMTAQLGCRAIMDVLGTLVTEGRIGHRALPSTDGPSPEEDSGASDKPDG